MAQIYDYQRPAYHEALESEPIRRNFQALATCHAGPDEPPQIWEGMLWLRTTDGVLLQYFGGAWKVLSVVAGETGLGRVYRHQLTATDIANKYILLPPPYVDPSQVMVHVEGAPILKRGEDYDVTINRVVWAGKVLEAVLHEGDVIVVQY